MHHADARAPLVYILHSGNLFGTERMALETLSGFRDYAPLVLAPPGPVLDEARRRGFAAAPFRGYRDLLRAVAAPLRAHPHPVFLTTGLGQALALAAADLWFRRRPTHLHLVHGGTDDFTSYGRKHLMNRFSLTFVAVSDFVRTKLIAHRVRPDKIRVVGNFLSAETRAGIRRRAPFTGPITGRGVVVSRIVPDKRVDLLLDTLARRPDLEGLSFDVLGDGGQLAELRARAAAERLPVRLLGFVPDVHQRLADYDFLLHLNGEEPFGMVLLEAMAAGLPVLVPDRGGTAGIVTHDRDGRHFTANDPDALASALTDLRTCDAAALNRLVAGGDRLLADTYAPARQLAAYRALIDP